MRQVASPAGHDAFQSGGLWRGGGRKAVRHRGEHEDGEPAPEGQPPQLTYRTAGTPTNRDARPTSLLLYPSLPNFWEEAGSGVAGRQRALSAFLNDPQSFSDEG